jgi:protein-S-isoprenylcysteine O-methyltransferase Ste14
VADPARAGLGALVLIGAAVFAVLPADFFATGVREVRRQRWATFLALASVAAALWFLPYADRRGLLVFEDGAALRLGGLGLFAVGMGLRLAATVQLGPRFSAYVTVQPGHRLVDTGLYRRVRHPIYAGSLLALVGLFLVFRSRLVVAALPVYLAGVLWRIGDEERLLAPEFGDAYRSYQRRTWRLFPFLY